MCGTSTEHDCDFFLVVSYVGDLRKLNTAPAQRETVRMSYEFALNHVGQDKDSGAIWNDYIQFLQSGEVHHAAVLFYTDISKT